MSPVIINHIRMSVHQFKMQRCVLKKNVHRYCTLEAKILQAVLRAYLGYKANHVSRKSTLRFSGFISSSFYLPVACLTTTSTRGQARALSYQQAKQTYLLSDIKCMGDNRVYTEKALKKKRKTNPAIHLYTNIKCTAIY